MIGLAHAAGGGARLPAGKEWFTQEQVVAALKAARGLVAPAAKRMQCDEKTVRNYLARYPELRLIAQEFRSGLVDVAEGKLAQALHAGDFRAVRLVLITLGKDRGYTVRMEATGPGGGAIPVSGEMKVEHEEVTPEHRRAGLLGIIAALRDRAAGGPGTGAPDRPAAEPDLEPPAGAAD